RLVRSLANRCASSSCSSASRCNAARPVWAIVTREEEFLAMLNDTSGGASDTEMTEIAVKPTGPRSPEPVTTQVLDAARPNAALRSITADGAGCGRARVRGMADMVLLSPTGGRQGGAGTRGRAAGWRCAVGQP